MRHFQKSLALAVAAVFLAGPVSAEPAVSKSTSEDQKRVEVTVYNSDLGLVKDRRAVTLPKGQGELRFMDVAERIMPVTVRAVSLNKPADFSVLEQNYEYDLMNHAKVLDKYEGRNVKIVESREFQDRRDAVEATLLSAEGEIYRIKDEIWLGHPGYKVVPEIPENLISKPTLTWLYENASPAPHELEVSYLTGGMSWQADYVAVLDAKDRTLDLSGWVTLTNESGATFRGAKLKLVAGEVNRVMPAQGGQVVQDMMMMRAASAPAPQFREKAFFEYHIYDLARPTTLKNRSSKQISLFDAHGVGAMKEFIVEGNNAVFLTQKSWENERRAPVNVFVAFVNSAENKLGMPLPAGTIRLYKEDDEESLQFVGEDSIEHTPKGEEVRLRIGEAFDLVAERTQTDYKQITSVQHETEWEITLRNRKDENVTITLLEPMIGNWKLITHSHPFDKEDAFTVKFQVPVPKNGEVKVQYRVRVGL